MARIAVVVAMAGSVSGCITTTAFVRTDDAFPVYGNPVNPTPAKGYRVECVSTPNLTYFAFDDFSTGCGQVIAPVEPVLAVRG